MEKESQLRLARSARLGLEARAVFPELESESGFSDGPNTARPLETEIEHSKAISAKRHADALDKSGITMAFAAGWDACRVAAADGSKTFDRLLAEFVGA